VCIGDESADRSRTARKPSNHAGLPLSAKQYDERAWWPVFRGRVAHGDAMEATSDPSQLTRIDALLAKAHQRKQALKSLCAEMASKGQDVSVEQRVLRTATVSVLLYYEWRRIVLDRIVQDRLIDRKADEKRRADPPEEGE
jgi:hypothetical protein